MLKWQPPQMMIPMLPLFISPSLPQLIPKIVGTPYGCKQEANPALWYINIFMVNGSEGLAHKLRALRWCCRQLDRQTDNQSVVAICCKNMLGTGEADTVIGEPTAWTGWLVGWSQ